MGFIRSAAQRHKSHLSAHQMGQSTSTATTKNNANGLATYPARNPSEIVCMGSSLRARVCGTAPETLDPALNSVFKVFESGQWCGAGIVRLCLRHRCDKALEIIMRRAAEASI